MAVGHAGGHSLSLNFIGKRSAVFPPATAGAGLLNGHIEEAMLGQKVIKVFNHEEQTKADFAVLNEELRSRLHLPNLAGVMMPLMSNLSMSSTPLWQWEEHC